MNSNVFLRKRNLSLWKRLQTKFQTSYFTIVEAKHAKKRKKQREYVTIYSWNKEEFHNSHSRGDLCKLTNWLLVDVMNSCKTLNANSELWKSNNKTGFYCVNRYWMIPFFALRFVDINDQMRFINLKKKNERKRWESESTENVHLTNLLCMHL